MLVTNIIPLVDGFDVSLSNFLSRCNFTVGVCNMMGNLVSKLMHRIKFSNVRCKLFLCSVALAIFWKLDSVLKKSESLTLI